MGKEDNMINDEGAEELFGSDGDESRDDDNVPRFHEDAEQDPEVDDGPDRGVVTTEFSKALDRLKEGRQRKKKMTIPKSAAYEEARALVAAMDDVRKKDYKQISDSRPAIFKLKFCDKLRKMVYRSGFPAIFADCGGVRSVVGWLTVHERQQQQGLSAVPVDVVNTCLAVLKRCNLDKDQVVESGCGFAVKAVLENHEFPLPTRMDAQQLVQHWIADVTGQRRQANELDEDAEEAALSARHGEAVAVDNMGRRGGEDERAAKRQRTGEPARMKSEAEMNKFWSAQAKVSMPDEEYNKRMGLRHALMPMDQPDMAGMKPPVAKAKEKTRTKLDPKTSIGKIDGTLKRLQNPNKKQWKATVGQVQVSGSNMVYKW